jgi:DNA-directed RNA polymerase specialized sigma24 family protein
VANFLLLRLLRLLFHLSGDVNLAQDLTQETFITAWQQIANFNGRASLKT